MKYLFDSCAVVVLVRELGEEAARALRGETILDLTLYELGNVVWKECTLRRGMSVEEAKRIARHVYRLLRMCRVLSLESEEDYVGVAEVAVESKLTFYDAAYLYVASKHGLILVTEDMKLYRAAEERGVEVTAATAYARSLKSKP